MSNKESYTPEEWAKMTDLPVIAATAVILASPNPMGLPDEVSAEGAAYALLRPADTEGELLAALRADLHERWARRDDLDAPATDLPLYTGSLHYSDPDQALGELSALAGEVSAILAGKAAPRKPQRTGSSCWTPPHRSPTPQGRAGSLASAARRRLTRSRPCSTRLPKPSAQAGRLAGLAQGGRGSAGSGCFSR
jgi:hypothetical protein